ncbi:MAG: serine/threonine-protein kinase [Myxococcota bacterium]
MTSGASTGASAGEASPEETMQRLGAELPSSLRLRAPIGAGGMGEVFVADDDALGEVVVKVMHNHLAPENADRLRMEGEALAKLRSPYVVRLHRWGVVEGRPYLVMERLQGQGLGDLVDEGPIEPVRAAKIATDVCRGLAVVHGAGVVHRDIKPDNVFLCPDRAVLLDFGVVKLIERVTGVQPLQKPTAAGAAVGTPRYMSPEQARGRKVDGRADIYAVGAMLFRMVTGEHLFNEKSLRDVLIAHCTKPPRRPSEVRPEVPASLDAVVLRAVEKEPGARFPSAEAMADALTAVHAPNATPLNETVMLDTDDPAQALGGLAPVATVAMRSPNTHPLPVQPAAAAGPAGPAPAIARTEAWIDGAPAGATPAGGGGSSPLVQTEAWDLAAPAPGAGGPASAPGA